MSAADFVVNLKSNDEQVVPISRQASELSKTLVEMVENITGEMQLEPIPVKFSAETLQLVAQWCEFHKNHPDPVEGQEPDRAAEEVVKQWDDEFFKIENDVLHDVFCAADFLNIEKLLDICATKAASLAEGLPIQELLDVYGFSDVVIEEDSQQEEETTDDDDDDEEENTDSSDE